MDIPDQPDQTSGDYQMARAVQIVNNENRDGIYLENEEAKLHALLAIGAYLRDLTEEVRAQRSAMAALAVPSVPVDQVADVVSDIVNGRLRQTA